MKHPILSALRAFPAVIFASASLLGAQQPPEPPAAPALPATSEPLPTPEFEPTIDRFDFRGDRKMVRIGSDVTVETNQSQREVVVVRGNVTLNGNVRHDVVVISGKAVINGRVGGDLVVVLGSAELGESAEVERDAVIIGGTLRTAAGARIGGDRIVFDPGRIPGLLYVTEWVRAGLLLGRPLPHQLGWVWVVAGVFLLLNVLLSVLFPKTIDRCVETVQKRPMGSLFAGLLVLVLFAPLMFLLAISMVGIVVIPFVICALVASLFLGKVTLYRYAGQQFGRQLGASVLENPMIALLAGTFIFYLLYMVPVIGFMVWAIVSLWGVGAVATAAAANFKREREKIPAPVAVSMPVMEPGGAGTGPSIGVPPVASAAPPVYPEPGTAMLPRVGFWARLMATLLDAILIVPCTFLVHQFLPLLWIAYHVGMWAWKGTTIGGIVLSQKVVRLDGRPIDLSVALVRSLSSILSLVAFGLGFFWAGWSREKQSWHDKIAGTVIAKVPKGMSLI